MNFKKLIGGFAAVALSATLFSVSVDALGAKPYIDERTPGKDYFLTVNSADANIPAWCKDSGVDVTEVYGVRYYIEVNDASQGFGGGIIINSTANNWESHDWGNADAAKEIVSDGTSVELLKDAPVFKADDAYANFCLQNWWGDWKVVDVDILGKDGAVLSTKDEAAPAEEEVVAEEEAAPVEEVVEEGEDVVLEEPEFEVEEGDEPIAVEEAPAEEAPAVEEAPAPAAVPATENTNTGNVPAAAAASVMALAAAAMAISKRK